MLTVSSIHAAYGNSQVLFGVSLKVSEGEIVTLLGRNGMGKTTTVRSIMGLLALSEGTIAFAGATLSGLESYQIARHGLGLVPEGRQVFPNLTVMENLVATESRRAGRGQLWTLNRIHAMFPELKARGRLMASQLSGGEQQMLAIGRALMTNPKLLILDEATEGLAPLVRQKIWTCIEAIRAEGLSLLVIDKNVSDLLRVADRHYILEKGKIVWEGDSQSLSAQTPLQNRYLGVSGKSIES